MKKELEGIFSWLDRFIYLCSLNTSYTLIQEFTPYAMVVGFVCA